MLDNHDEYVWISVLISREKSMDGAYGSDNLLLCLVQNIEERKNGRYNIVITEVRIFV